MKDLILPVEVTAVNSADRLSVVRGGCLHCRRDLRWVGDPLLRADRPVRCRSCGTEHRVDVSADGLRAKVRLPRNCEAWFEVESTNLAAAGRRGADLLVRFRNGAEYVYPGAGPLLGDLLRAESKGKFFLEKVRPRPCRRLP